MADLTGPNPDEVNGVDSRGVALTAKPVLVGARGSDVAPSAVTAGQAVDIWASLTGAQVVDGGIAHDAVDSGNPLKIGGKAADGPTAVADGDRVNMFLTRLGHVVVATDYAGTSGSDAQGMSAFGYRTQTTVGSLTPTAVAAFVYNGSTWDRARSGGVTGMQGIAGATAADAVIAGNPVTIGGRASTAVPSAVSADGDVVDARFLRTGALTVHIVDASGNAASLGGGTQYVGDAAATATPTGTMHMGLAAAAVPSAVSADNDAVAAWFLRNGIQNVRLVDSAGSALSVGGGTQYTEDVAISANAGIGNLMIGRRDDALSTLTPVEGDAVGLRVGDKGALWVQITDGAGAQITSFGGGTQYAADTAIGVTPTGTLSIGRGSASIPTAMTADGDAVGLWASLNGSLNVILRDTSGVAVQADTQYADDAALGAVGAGGTGTLMLARGSLAVPTAVSADSDATTLWTDLRGRLTTKQSAGTATLTNVASSATSVTVLAANTGRLGATVMNDSNQVLYLKMGATASATSFTVKLAAGGYYEVPFGYTDILDGIWNSANGNARVTELT